MKPDALVSYFPSAGQPKTLNSAKSGTEESTVTGEHIMYRKGQQTGSAAAITIGIIALLIVFYILFLPPEDRARLLGEEYHAPSSGGSGSTGTGSTGTSVTVDTSEPIFTANPGMIDYSSLDEYQYELPAFTIRKTTDAAVLESMSNFYIRNGWFDKQNMNFSFKIDEIDNTDNVLLSITLAQKKGRLIIALNGKEIYNFEPRQMNIDPIELPGSYLIEGENALEFSVSDVGMEFWTTNEYSVENMKITADITDTTRQESKNYFYVTEEEGENIKSATLKFNPDCRVSDTGYLDVYLNNVEVFSGIPDCGILNTYMLSPSVLMVGKNTLKFRTEEGSYLIDQIAVNTKLKEPTHPTFYFDLDEELFDVTSTYKERCGDVDGICPDGCDEDLDQDCCFSEYDEPFWCDVPTRMEGDRCVGFVSAGTCDRCSSGYEDKSGNAADDCEDLCGDDKDGDCPNGCSVLFDKDCCYDLDGDQYWCNDLPITGVSFACVDEVSRNNCQNCQTGYKGESGNPSCDVITSGGEEKEKLKKDFDIMLRFEFTERGSEKEARIWVNGYETGFDTKESAWMKNIDSYAEIGTNSIKIMPKSELEIKEIKVYFD